MRHPNLLKPGLFEAFGVELEYMIVDRQSLAIRPIAEKIFLAVNNEISSDFENGDIAWSNELVAHVVELKTNGPAPAMAGLENPFMENISRINEILDEENAMLLGSGAHPWMDPMEETHIWPHEYNEVYQLYNRIFDCRGHGWSNLQSTHLNLPFSNEQEFERLHAAIRLILPLIPSLAASTPILDGVVTGFRDARLEKYRLNQRKIPVLAGRVIPEQVWSREQYDEKIFRPIREAIRPWDTEKILDQQFLNSRGAIARFDRGAIEIRVIDIQECPTADLAVLSAITAAVKALANEQWCSLEEMKSRGHEALAEIFEQAIIAGEDAVITDADFLSCFGISAKSVSAGEIWDHLIAETAGDLPQNYQNTLRHIRNKGTLSSRIIEKTGCSPERNRIHSVYMDLAECLKADEML